MTEKEWLKCKDPVQLLQYLRGRATDRQVRHLMAEFVGWILDGIGDTARSEVIGILDQFADGELSRETLQDRVREYSESCDAFRIFGFPWCSPHLRDSLYDDLDDAFVWSYRPLLPDVAEMDVSVIAGAIAVSRKNSALRTTSRQKLSAVRDISGNPFRPVTADPEWRTSTVVAIAQQMYESRDFSRMLILADALEDAGCTNADVLDHCRCGGTHVRGCWVIDLILGRNEDHGGKKAR